MKKIIFWGLMLVTIPVFAGQPSEFVYDEKGIRDPFWPLVSPSGTIVSYGNDISISDMILEGIITDAQKGSIAIINGNVVKEKDKIGSYIIQRIETEMVLLKKDQETFKLYLPKGGKQ